MRPLESFEGALEGSFALHLFQASWQAGVLVLVVLALRAMLGTKLAPRWRVALWLVVFARLALMVVPAAPFSLFNLLAPAPASASVRASLDAPIGANEAPAPLPAQLAAVAGTAQPAVARGDLTQRGATPLPLSALLLGVWALGALALLAAVGRGHLRIARRLRRAQWLREERILALVEDCRRALGVRTPIAAMESADVRSPMLVGVIRPVLLLPTGLADRLGPEGMRAVVMHEVAHVKRADIRLGWVTTALLIVHWFNPLIWVALSRLRSDRELACDGLALAHLDDAARGSYAATLIELLQHARRPRIIPGMAAIAEGPENMKRRIQMITTHSFAASGSPALGVSLLVGLGCTGLTTQMPAHADAADADAAHAVAGQEERRERALEDAGEDASPLTALEVLERVSRTYRDARTYQDEGEVSTAFIHEGRGGLPRTTIRPFSTAFVRAGERFHFEFRDHPGTGASAYHVWSDGEAIRTWWKIRPEVLEFSSFGAALAGPSAVSGGSALGIPELLLPELWSRSSLLRVRQPELAGTEEMDGHPCFKISGVDSRGQPASLWVDQESFLIRRAFSRMHVDPSKHRQPPSLGDDMPAPDPDRPAFDTETTISFRPRLDQEIPDGQLVFEPPR